MISGEVEQGVEGENYCPGKERGVERPGKPHYPLLLFPTRITISTHIMYTCLIPTRHIDARFLHAAMYTTDTGAEPLP